MRFQCKMRFVKGFVLPETMRVKMSHDIEAMMEAYEMTKEQIQSYAENLRMEEHSESTVQKYANALTAFYDWLSEDKSVIKERLLAWKAEIGVKNAASTVNR